MPNRIVRLRWADLPEGVRSLAWMNEQSVIVYTDRRLTREQRGDAVGRALLALQVHRFGRSGLRPNPELRSSPDLPQS